MRFIAKFPLLLVLGLALAGAPAFAKSREGGREERQKRRELRERREKIRLAMKRVDTCLRTGELLPCVEDKDSETQEAVLEIYMKRLMNQKKLRLEYFD